MPNTSGIMPGERQTRTRSQPNVAMGAKRKSQQHKQQSSSISPDVGDGDVKNLTEHELEEDYPVPKKHKTSTQSLLSGMPMNQLYAEVPAMQDKPAKPRVQPARAAKAKVSKSAMPTPTIWGLVDRCAVVDADSPIPTQERDVDGPVESSLARSKLGNFDDCSYVIVPDSDGDGIQDFIQVKHVVGHPVKAAIKNSAETRRTRVLGSTGSKGKEPRGGTAFYQHGSDARHEVQHAYKLGESYSPGEHAIDRKTRVARSNTGPDSDSDTDYDFIEHPPPSNKTLNRFEAVRIIDPQEKESAVVALFDTGSESDFISQKIVDRYNFQPRPLRLEDVAEYTGLQESCCPMTFVTIKIRFEWQKSFCKQSFRVIQNDNIDLILGANTISKRNIKLQEDNFKGAFPSFKKKPNDEQAAAQKAMLEYDRSKAKELMKPINSATSSARGRSSNSSSQHTSTTNSSSSPSSSWSDKSKGGRG